MTSAETNGARHGAAELEPLKRDSLKSKHDYFAGNTEGLGRRAVKGGIFTAFGQAAAFSLHLISTTILARLLSPDDFGLVAMVTAVTGLITLFGDSGLSMATVQRAEINRGQVNTLFWINSGLGVFLAALTIGIAPIVAWFYHDTRLLLVTAAIALGFIFRGVGVQHSALLRRNLMFRRLTIANVSGAAFGYTMGVISAFAGVDYWALVVQSVSTAFGVSAALWVVCDWRPGRPAWGSGVKSMLGFGGALTASNLLNYIMRNFDNLIVGWFWGPAVIGLYSRSYAIMMLPMSQLSSPISQVAMPALSRVQNDPERFKRAYYNGVTLVVAIALPVSVALAVCAEPFVLTMLGGQWTGAVPIFIALAPAAFLSTFTQTIGWVYNSLGRGKRQLKWTLIVVPIYMLGFAVALPYGAVAVATSFSVLLAILITPTFRYAFKGTPLSLWGLWSAIGTPIMAALFAGASVFGLRGTIDIAEASPLTRLVVGVGLYATVYILFWISFPGGRHQLRSILEYTVKSSNKPVK